MSDLIVSEEAKAKFRRLMEARTKRDELDKAAKEAKAEFQEIEAEVFEALEKLRDPNDPNATRSAIKVHLGEPWGTVSFRGRETRYGRIVDEEAALEYFEQRQMIEEVTRSEFAKKRLHEIVRDHYEQGLDMPPGVDYYTNSGVTITRQK